MLHKLIELSNKINSLNHEELIKEIEKTKLEMKLQESTRGVVDFETTLKATMLIYKQVLNGEIVERSEIGP